MNQNQNEPNSEKVEKKHNYFYKTTNLINGKYYYGIHSTDNLEDGYMGSGTLLRRSIKKHGNENFIKVIIADYSTRKEASDHERMVVKFDLIVLDECYNMKTGGDNEHTHIVSDETKAKISIGNTGKRRSDEGKRRISEANSGRLVGELNHNFGKPMSEETKLKLAFVNIGKIVSEETRRKMGNSRRGKTHTAETKLKMSKWQIGKIVSEETRQTISDRVPKKICIIEGITYKSIKSVAQYYNITASGASFRIKSQTERWNQWNFAE